METIDIGGANPVDGDRISEIYYPSCMVVLYNQATGKTVDRTLKTMEACDLVELLGGTDVFACYQLPDTGAVAWLRRSLIRGVVEGQPNPSAKIPEPWSIVQMVYHLPMPDPWPWSRKGWRDAAFTISLPVAEARALLDARSPIHWPAFTSESGREVPSSKGVACLLKSSERLAEVGGRILASARPQAHLVAVGVQGPGGSLLVDHEGQSSLALIAVIDVASLEVDLGPPLTGSLSFFYYYGSQTWGDRPAHAQRFSVRYSDQPLRDIVGELRALPMAVVSGIGLPPIDSTDGGDLGLDSDQKEEAYLDLLEKL